MASSQQGKQCLLVLAIALAGAAVSHADGTIDLEKGREFWAFKSPVKTAPPAVVASDWPRTPIDQFVLARLEADGKPAPAAASPLQLVRRAYFDLHGLPPTPQQAEAFLADTRPDRFERLVDELLASPRFGERWGRHWLDVVRFAESTGGGRTMLLEHSWRYRDYVVDSFNEDKPYDRFLTEQLAGDLLDSTDPQEQRDNLVATTFLALGPNNYELQDKELLTMEIVDEQVDTIGRTFLAMTLGCARCHDHMFDPISARDYYALAGIFKSTKTVEHSNVSKWLMAELPPATPQEQEAAQALTDHKKRLATTTAELKTAEADLKRIGEPATVGGIIIDDADAARSGQWVASTSVPKWVGAGYIHDNHADGKPHEVVFSKELPSTGRYEVRVSYSAGSNRSSKSPVTVHHNAGETVVRIDQRKAPDIGGLFKSVGIFEFGEAEASVTISNEGSDGVTIADAVQFIPLEGEAPAADDRSNERQGLQEKIAALEAELKEIQKNTPKLKKPQTMTVRDAAKPADIPISLRGSVHEPGEIVPRGFPEVIQIGNPPGFSPTGSGRLELAQWLTAEDHPLTARVMANRIWLHLMGEGIVSTPDNFGSTGQRPSDPQLLDWLALRLIDKGWSIKQTVREILLSQSYQSARPRPRRLDAESMRDAILLASGRLDDTIGGPAIKPGTRSEFGYKFDSERRSLYLPVFRNSLPDLFAVFDFPDPNLVSGKRNTSTLATQALYFMNHPFVIEQSRHAADDLLTVSDAGVPERIDHAYRETLGRSPGDKELALAKNFLGDDPDLDAWAAFYQSLFACIDFRYVE